VRFEKGNKVGKQFQPGKSGNPGGRPKTKYISEALRAALEDGGAEELAKVLLKLGREGLVVAIKEIADRTEGRAKEHVEITGGDGGPIAHTIEFAGGKKPDAR
jgi:hypothetical protein